MGRLCHRHNHYNSIALWLATSGANMRGLEYVNEIVQGLVVLLLVYNAIKTRTLTLYQIIVTLAGVLFNFYTRYVSKQQSKERASLL